MDNTTTTVRNRITIDFDTIFETDGENAFIDRKELVDALKAAIENIMESAAAASDDGDINAMVNEMSDRTGWLVAGLDWSVKVE